MVTIPLYTLLFAYLLFLAIFFVFSMINFYHIIVTASFTFASFVVTFIIFTLTVLTFYFTWQLLMEIDWQAPIIVFNSGWISEVFNF
jgi:hypothetical protein